MLNYYLSETVRNKLLSIEARLKEHQFPPQLVIENTSACNQQCIHCSHREMTRPRKHMARELWDKLVREIAAEQPNCEVWPTFYGEALILGKELWDRIDYAAQVGCTNLVLNSNATLLTRKQHIDWILTSPLKRFIVSLDGFTKETYEKIRIHGKWDVVYPGVEKILERKAQLGTIYPAIICQFSLMEENEHEVEAFRSYWNNRGAEVKVRPKLEWTATGTVRSERIDHDTNFRITCPWGNNTMAVHQDGTIVACAVDYDARFKIGNAWKQSLKVLWQLLGTRLREPHRTHRWQDIPDICKGCRDWQTAGAEYEKASISNTRPFWYEEEARDQHIMTSRN